jgi:Zn-dependent M28 family amino/carboxypeptidase
MKRNIFSILTILSLCIVATAQQATTKFATADEIKELIALAPCKDKERLEAVKKLFIKMGASESDITVEKLKDVENIILTKKGKTEETVIIGAHYDKVADGCGAIDNWTGIVILANLYRTMKDFNMQKTYKFVAFGKEELGLLGSNEMADAIPKEKRTNYCAMVNFDSFGFAYPQAMGNTSDKLLMDLAKEASNEMKIPFTSASIEGASADSQSFRENKIPAITLHGMDARWPEFLHGPKDKAENVNAQSVYVGYRHALVFLSKIENKPCDTFRK